MEWGNGTRAKLEGKIATLSAINGSLQQELDSLQEQMENLEAAQEPSSEELAQLQEEFRRRLATSDRTVSSLKVRVACAVQRACPAAACRDS